MANFYYKKGHSAENLDEKFDEISKMSTTSLTPLDQEEYVVNNANNEV